MLTIILRVLDVLVLVVMPVIMWLVTRGSKNRDDRRKDQLDEIKDLQTQIYTHSKEVGTRLTNLEISTRVHDQLLSMIVGTLNINTGKINEKGKE